MNRHFRARSTGGFSLVEIMAVTLIIIIMTGAVALTMANSQPSVKVRRDAGQTIAFLRNMWDHTKATGAPLVLSPDFETGELSYVDPRSSQKKEAKFASGAKVLGVKLNDRLYSAASLDKPADEDAAASPNAATLYIGEGRGLTKVAILFGVPDGQDSYRFITLASLNLINGKGTLKDLDPEALAEVLAASEQVEGVHEEL